MRKLAFLPLALLVSGSLFLTSCGDDDKDDNNGGGGTVGGGDLSGEVSGTLTKGTYNITSDITVPEGQELRLEAGVILAFDGDGLSPETSPQITVAGDLIALGTENDPVMFTVPADRRDPSNAYEGFWGGIQCLPTCNALILQHAIVEYTGGPSAQNEIYDAGDPRYAIHFANPSGILVFDHSILRHIADDGIRPQGGARLAVLNSQFYNIGETGGEGINMKDGTVGDVAYNLFYSVATNGSKPAGEGDGVPQTNIANYNNTFINCGFRRVQSGRGGSINFEDGAKGINYNNLIVNSRFGIRFRGDKLPDLANIEYDHTHYYANDPVDEDNFMPSTDVNAQGDRLTSVQPNDIIQQDPLFVNYPVSTDKMTANLDAHNFDFHLQANAPGVGAGKTDFSPIHSTLSARGVTITMPAPSNFIGAYGTK